LIDVHYLLVITILTALSSAWVRSMSNGPASTVCSQRRGTNHCASSDRIIVINSTVLNRLQGLFSC